MSADVGKELQPAPPSTSILVWRVLQSLGRQGGGLLSEDHGFVSGRSYIVLSLRWQVYWSTVKVKNHEVP
jgi:hypothetical protein